jgi:2-polyprenyl-3-methyl-5-hydroxy-6-metoxy-1,4-benzoquinol methylase
MSPEAENYILETGAKDVERLQLLEQAYGPQSEALLLRAGLREGLRIVEVGCGSGNMSCWLAEQVGPSGSVVGLDRSAGQVEQACKQAMTRGLRNVQFQVADAYKPGLPESSFDMAYCRLVLMHLTHPIEALRAMRELVRPGGQVLCEEMDLNHWFVDPPSALMHHLFKLNIVLGARNREHFTLGASLHHLFREVGFSAPEVSANFPLLLRGKSKRLVGMSFVEFSPQLVRAGLATQTEVDAIAAEAARVADDETTLFGLPLVVQVRAVR